jgi:predicted ABC-type ATPase
LRGSLKVDEFVNADTLAQGLSAFRPDTVALEAGRITLERLGALAAQGRSFAFESTLASQSLARRLETLKTAGYTVHVLYLWLPDVNLAVARVAERARSGGHDVPVDAIRRRYERGRRNFFMLYRPLADRWRVYDASSVDGPRLAAAGGAGLQTRVLMPHAWRAASEGYDHE